VSLVIVDTGCANLASVGFAFERIGTIPQITDKRDIISDAERIIIPGVGSAPFAMEALKQKGLLRTLREFTRPALGICLGMQILFEQLHEGPEPVKGLGVIPGDVVKLNTRDLPSPHMGWNQLQIIKPDPLLDGIANGIHAYFVHSFAATTSEYCLASSTYGTEFAAIVRHNNFYGCQFHPERSSAAGSRILQNFIQVPL